MTAGDGVTEANGGMKDNEEALAGLLYLAWAGVDKVPLFEELPRGEQFRWHRVARFQMHSEVDLCAKLARDSYRKRFEQRLIERLDRWNQGK